MTQGSSGWRVLCAAGFTAMVVGNAAAAQTPSLAACEIAPLSIAQSLDIPAAGKQTVRRVIDVPADADIEVVATEQNIDVVLELPEFASIADNPARRLGPQRIVVRTGRKPQLIVEIRGKERDAAPGHVHIDVIRLARARSRCETARELLAKGDAHYARAQLAATSQRAAPAGHVRHGYTEAVSSYDAAVGALASEGPSLLLGQALLSAAATSYQDLQDWNGAAARSERAASVCRDVANTYGAARARAMSAAAGMEVALSMPSGPNSTRSSSAMAMLADARESFDEIAALHAQRGERFDQALALNNLGIAYYYEGQFDRALRAYALARPIYAALQERQREAQVLQNMALIEYELGRFRSARQAFLDVQALLDESENAKLYADVLNNLALAELGAGYLDAALDHYSAALQILTRLQSPREQARSLHGIGAVYYAMGDGALATGYFHRALTLRTSALDARGRMATLRALANVSSDEKRYVEALALHEEALSLAVAPTLQTRILVQLANTRAALGQRAEALEAVNKALSLASDQDRIATARAWAMRAGLLVRQSDLIGATRDVQAALPVFRTFESLQDEMSALLLSARIHEAGGVARDAESAVDAALTLAEKLRVQSANPEIRAALWRMARPAFDLKIRLSLQSGSRDGTTASSSQKKALAALELAEQFRGRALADYRRLTVASAFVPDATNTARREALYMDLGERRAQLETRLERAGERGGELDPTVIAIRNDIATLGREIDRLNSALAVAGADAPRAQKFATGLRGWAATIPEDAAVIEYWLSERAALAWILTKNRVDMIELNATADIDTRARHLQESVVDFGSFSAEERQSRARALAQLIIAPLPAYALRKRTLIFIPDGALHAVPFATLAWGEANSAQDLVLQHDVAIAASLADLTGAFPEHRTNLPAAVLILADPVYSRDDERVAGTTIDGDTPQATQMRRRGASGNDRFRRLYGAQREASAIVALFPPGTVDRIEGLGATREEFLRRDLSRYGYIHVAAHAVSDAASPKLSRIVLSTVDAAGKPQVGDVFAGDLALRRLNADLVVFSGCETALGQEVAGEGLVGLQYAAHASGARAVVASLWEVSDRASASLMADFYARLTKERLAPRVALAEAMRRARTRYSDPVLWAGYQISISAGTPLH